MKALTLSLIIPVYNEELYLNACLDAIAAQTTKPLEVLVVDNNSTDKSVEIASGYPFVTVLQEPTQGVLAARNTGFNTAKGDVIGRIDADTILPPNWVETVVYLLQDKDHAAVNGPVSYYEMPGGSKNYWIDHQIRLHLYKGDRRAPFLFGSNSALRKSAWLSVRDKVCTTRRVHEDLDLAIHLVQNDLSILYDKRLLASTSARRYDDHFTQFRHYMAMYLYTYRHHHIKSIFPQFATIFYWVGYVILQPLRRSYDPTTRKHSFRQLVRRTVPRKNPMSDS